MGKRTFELPDLGEGIAEGELVSWAVQPGDSVKEDDVIAEVETDKALVEVPSRYNGTVLELHAEEGEMVPVDSAIVTFAVDDGTESTEKTSEPGGNDEPGVDTEQAATETEATDRETAAAGGDSGSTSSSARVFASPSTRTLARKHDIDLSSLAGSGMGGRITAEDVHRATDSGTESTVEGKPETETEAGITATETTREANDEPTTAVVGGDRTRGRTLAMPATRRLATEHDIELNDVPASEQREGEAFVTPGDVHAYVDGQTTESSSSRSTTVESATPEPAVTDTEAVSSETPRPTADESVSGERVPYRGIRRTIGERMAQSKYTAPHVSHHDQLDANGLVRLRAELADAAERDGVKLTYLPFVVKAVTAALQAIPPINSSLDEEAEEIVLHDEYNVGIAVATDAGLMVPVVKHADRKGLKQLATEIDDLASRARNRELSRDEMRGGTFTITNVGVIGGEFSAPIINYPEAAILAMGPIQKRPWVVDDEVVARETMTLSMSVDHRLVDGAEAARFSNHVKDLLGDPVRLLLE